MLQMLIVLVLLELQFFKVVEVADLPEYIKPCSRNDIHLNECALRSAKESIHQFSLGNSSRGLKPLDPLYVAEMTVFIPNKNGLKIAFTENYFKGLSNLTMEQLKFDLNKKQITADALVNLDVECQYELGGKILLVPIKSNGDASIKLKNTMLHIRIWYEHVEGVDGEIHWRIYKHDVKYDVDRAMFKLENLLNDRMIGDQVNKLLNEMWREVVSDVGPSICNSLSDAVVKNLALLLEQVPYNKLMPE